MNRHEIFAFGLLLLATPGMSAGAEFGIGSKLPEFPKLRAIDDQEVAQNAGITKAF